MTLTLALRRIGLLAAAALLVTAVGMKPLHAMGGDTPPQPTDDGSKKKKFATAERWPEPGPAIPNADRRDALPSFHARL